MRVLPCVKPSVRQRGSSLLGAGEVDDAPHDEDHQGEDQEEQAGNPTLNQGDEVASQEQTQTSH